VIGGVCGYGCCVLFARACKFLAPISSDSDVSDIRTCAEHK